MGGTPRILIAGAGIGGLAAALALLQRGYDVQVYEQAGAFGEVGAGLQIAANGSRVLDALGLTEAIGRIACETRGKVIRLWDTGQTWKLFDLGAISVQRYGAPYYTLHRGDFHGVLVEAVRRMRPDALHVAARCVGCAQTDDGVTLHLADGRAVAGDALIGADGVHSAIRNALFGEGRAHFTGLMAWRGLVPAERLPERMREPIGTNWVGPGGHVVHYLLRRGELLNFVGIVERDDWRVESWTERGTTAECAADFRGWNADVQAIIGHIEAPFKWALVGREPLPAWSVGRITLLGDACHPMLPFLAQGANMALEDAWLLARCLDRQRDDVPGALRAYEHARLERTARTVHGSAENLQRFHNRVLATSGEAAAYVAAQWSEERVKQRYDWLFEYDATGVPIADVPALQSPRPSR